jgi:hypothetical protein
VTEPDSSSVVPVERIENAILTLRSQFVTSNRRGGRWYRPYAFTEQGVAMLSSVLRSKRTVQVNIEIMRAFACVHRILAGLERKKDLGWPATRLSNIMRGELLKSLRRVAYG